MSNDRPALPDAVFHRDGERFVPTELARGPWDPNAQHGGPCAALLAGLLEQHDAGPPAHVARMTIELLRPVPMQSIELRARPHRPIGPGAAARPPLSLRR